MSDWILRKEGTGLPIRVVRLGEGIDKGFHVGAHRGEEAIDDIAGFLALTGALGAPEPGVSYGLARHRVGFRSALRSGARDTISG
ncbi:hypothetical protein D2T31_16875 [Sinirhodobacter populi]|uniref:Uncharacterized protein n=1 Tax=Paenirhodobacter populi TaxID=2306993 RepID=A0A443K3I4_9RHOB|nr:hypothetical protein [Sinirhodobacter populi]RWR27326.1 hypothetical protein D2T31_16875 [Sinirhodobacter populi]